MSAGNRPGGLTALAVLNFVAAGNDAIGVIGSGIWLAVGDQVRELPEVQEALAESAVPLPPDEVFWTAVVGDPILVALLIVSGIGYLRMRRVTGRWVGTAYALTSLVLTGVAFHFMQSHAAATFGAMINMVYPLVTLILLHTTFKDDLVT